MPEGQPLVELQKSQLALTGSLITHQKETTTVLNEILDQLKMLNAKASAPVEEPEVTEPASTEDVEMSANESEQKQMITKLHDRLDRLMDLG